MKKQKIRIIKTIWNSVGLVLGLLAIWYVEDIRIKLLGLWMMIINWSLLGK